MRILGRYEIQCAGVRGCPIWCEHFSHSASPTLELRKRFMAHPVDIHVGQRLRHRRWLVGKTQQQLAVAIGIKFQQIQKYESGANRISASRLWDISQALNIPISYFFEGIELDTEETGSDDSLADKAPGPDVLYDKETLGLVRAYYALEPLPRRRFLELAKSLAQTDDD